MRNVKVFLIVIVAALAAGLGPLGGCNSGGARDGSADADTDTDTDGDTDTDADDCSACEGVLGETLEAMLCAIDLCDQSVLLGQEYTSPSSDSTATTFAAVERFGDADNGLAPVRNGSYALMATGPATGTDHDVNLEGDELLGIADPFDTVKRAYDVMEWRLHLTAPVDAHGFEIDYVFFSEEYDEYIDSSWNDKFYIFKSPPDDDENRTITNFTECRDPESYYNFICEAGDPACVEGEKYCYIAINTAYSDCCWYNGCPGGTSDDVGTDISGTGFECASSEGEEAIYPNGGDTGSSTGWLKTSWPCEPGETFDLVFHIHDTADGEFDSEVILDNFRFVGTVDDPGTVPIE